MLLVPAIAGGVGKRYEQTEHYPDDRLSELTHAEIARYSRHLLLPEVGLEGQKASEGRPRVTYWHRRGWGARALYLKARRGW